MHTVGDCLYMNENKFSKCPWSISNSQVLYELHQLNRKIYVQRVFETQQWIYNGPFSASETVLCRQQMVIDLWPMSKVQASKCMFMIIGFNSHYTYSSLLNTGNVFQIVIIFYFKTRLQYKFRSVILLNGNAT